jgi:hypothetical protein
MRRGVLRHGNPAGDPSTAPRCGASTRNGGACRAPAMQNPKTGRLHALSNARRGATGPRTREGLERCRKAQWKHGRRSANAIAARKRS